MRSNPFIHCLNLIIICLNQLEWVSPQTGVDAGGGINGYKQRSCEYIVSLSDTFTL